MKNKSMFPNLRKVIDEQKKQDAQVAEIEAVISTVLVHRGIEINEANIRMVMEEFNVVYDMTHKQWSKVFYTIVAKFI